MPRRDSAPRLLASRNIIAQAPIDSRSAFVLSLIDGSNGIDALVVPTAGTIYTVEQVLADPVQLGARLTHALSPSTYYELQLNTLHADNTVGSTPVPPVLPDTADLQAMLERTVYEGADAAKAPGEDVMAGVGKDETVNTGRWSQRFIESLTAEIGE